MEYNRLGKSGLYISKLCLGCASFGIGKSTGVHDWGQVDEKEAYRIMDEAVEHGINFFDTANVYGSKGYPGLSEEIIGRWFKLGNQRREKVVLGTKVGRMYGRNLGETNHVDGPNNREGLSLYKIRRHVEESLRRMQVEKIELYTMHKRDQETGWDEVWEAFEGLVREGKVDYVGASNHDAWELAKAQETAKRRNFMGLVSEQHFYTPLNRFAELEMLPMALDYGIGITVYSPLCRGLLGIDMTRPDKHPLNPEAEYSFEHIKEQLHAYTKLAHEIGEVPANLTLAWELAHPAVNSVIIAPNTPADLRELLHSLTIIMTSDIMEAMDEIFPPVSEFNPYVPWGVRAGHL